MNISKRMEGVFRGWDIWNTVGHFSNFSCLLTWYILGKLFHHYFILWASVAPTSFIPVGGTLLNLTDTSYIMYHCKTFWPLIHIIYFICLSQFSPSRGVYIKYSNRISSNNPKIVQQILNDLEKIINNIDPIYHTFCSCFFTRGI